MSNLLPPTTITNLLHVAQDYKGARSRSEQTLARYTRQKIRFKLAREKKKKKKKSLALFLKPELEGFNFGEIYQMK